MKKIYISHSTSFDFKKELYEPIRKSYLDKEYNFVLPHEDSEKLFNSKEYLRSCDLVIAEVSYPSTGLGIELGWANLYKVPIVCIYKTGFKLSNSLKAVCNSFIEYTNSQDMISKIALSIPNLQK